MKKFGKDKDVRIIKIRKNDYLIIKPQDVDKLKHYHIEPEVPYEDKVETRNVPLNRFYNSNGMTSNRGAYQHSYDDPSFRHLKNYDEDSYIANASRPFKVKYKNKFIKNRKGLDTFSGMYNKSNNIHSDRMPFNKDDAKYFKSNNHEYDLMAPAFDNVDYKTDRWPGSDSDEDEATDDPFGSSTENEPTDDQLSGDDVKFINNGESGIDKSEFEANDKVKKPNNNFKGLIRTVRGASLVFKKEELNGNFNELWIYNIGDDSFKESKIRKSILAGTDINPDLMTSDDEKQKAQTYTMGNIQFLELTGLPN